MNRMQSFQKEINDIIIENIKNNMPEPKMIHASFCNDLNNSEYRWAWSDFMIPSGVLSLKKWVNDSGFEITTKKESSMVLIVGGKNECDLWVNAKRIWLKNK